MILTPLEFDWALADRRIEAIPALLQDAIVRLVDLQVMTAKPDSCIIDVYNEVGKDGASSGFV